MLKNELHLIDRSSSFKTQFLTVSSGNGIGRYSFTPSSGASGGSGQIGPTTHLRKSCQGCYLNSFHQCEHIFNLYNLTLQEAASEMHQECQGGD